MYLRHTTVTKNGKSHTYWRLVRSIRTGNRVRQQTVAQLGELDAAGRVRARALAEAIVGVERQPGLFEAPDPSAAVTVELRRFRLERGRRFGDVWLGLRLWQALVDDSKQYYNAIYARLGVTLTDADLAPESFYNQMLADVCDELEQSGVAVMSDGALCVFPPGFTGRDNQPFPLILRKSDGG